MYEDFIHCLEEEHANDKKITFEYPENDLEETKVIPTVSKEPKVPVVDKPAEKNSEELDNSFVEERGEKNKLPITKSIIVETKSVRLILKP